MLVKVNEQKRIVEIWLSSIEKNSDRIRRQAELICDEYAANKYTSVLFFSGEHDLKKTTSNLLILNKRKLAEKDHSHEI